MTSPPVAGIVLAAGLSSRMDGGCKLLRPFGDGVVVEAPVRAAFRAGLRPVIVVTGHRSEEVRGVFTAGRGPAAARRRGPVSAPGGGRPADERPRLVHNARYRAGQSTSLARGIREVRAETDAAAAAVLLGDEPGVRADAVRRIAQAWRRRASRSDDDPPVVRARYRDRRGHPVVFPRDVFGELGMLGGDRGARGWLERNAERVEAVHVDAPAPADVDTEEDYRTVAREEERARDEARGGPGPPGRPGG